MLDQLTLYIETHFVSFLEAHGFLEVEMQHDGMGALLTYESIDFEIRFVNDRGIIESDLFGFSDRSNLFQAPLYFYMLNLENSDSSDKYSEKLALSKVLTADETVEFLNDNYQVIADSLSQQNYSTTKARIETVRERRSKFLFPRI